MRFFLAAALALLAALPATADPAPFHPCRDGAAIPPRINAYLAARARHSRVCIEVLKARFAKEKDEKRRASLAEQLKRCWCGYYDSAVRTLKNVRDLQEKTILGRRLSGPEVRAINRAIADYERQWAEAVRKGMADPPQKPRPRRAR